MATQTTQPFTIRELSTNRFRATFKDENGTVIPAASLTTVTLTWYDTTDLSIINSRNAQNVLNANNVTIDANGVLTWEMQPNDAAVTATEAAHKPGNTRLRRALFIYTYATGAKGNNSEFEFQVLNVRKVGAA